MAKIQKVRIGVIIKLFSAVIKDTPVLFGFLRGNWRISEGEPILDARPEFKDPNGTTVSAEVIDGSLKTTGDVKVYLTNNLPYAYEIEHGGSRKQPEGMMRKNVARFDGLISNVLSENK